MSIATITTAANQIDVTYPIAGQDNNTQGFRDNFSNIKDGLVTTGSELQILSDAAARKDVDNNFLAGKISSPKVVNFRGIVQTTSTDTPTIDASSADYFRIEAKADATITLGGWPNVSGTPLFRKITLEFFGNGTEHEILFASNNPYTSIYVDDDTKFGPLVIPASAYTRTVIEAWVNKQDEPTYLKWVGVFEADGNTNTANIPIFPNFTTTNRNSIDNVKVGMTIYNTTDSKLQICTSITPSVVWTDIN